MDTTILRHSSLFQDIRQEEILAMLACLGARQVSYARGETIFREGDRISEIGLLLSGYALIHQVDFWGNRSIIAEVPPAGLFGEAYACLPKEPMGVGVTAAEASEVLFVNIGKALHLCSSACAFHEKMVQNLIMTLARRNLALTRKMTHTGKRSIREKLLSYLSEEARKKDSVYFTIPFSRQELADYLGVDRSALSKELSKLREEGVLDYNRSMFRLLRGNENSV
ncbi:MAG: Crp/Fnr family transcriptional regulator [Peptococcaceae bacterium]|nr:Crp/Fnr family transcriptional regulator [Peptococcaceae bacterium]